MPVAPCQSKRPCHTDAVLCIDSPKQISEGDALHIEKVTLTGFRCFGPMPTAIELEPTLTTFIGNNGAGKTAAMIGLLRLFGTRQRDRRIKLQDFHVAQGSSPDPNEMDLAVDVIAAFPELNDAGEPTSVPAFFRNMCADSNGDLKCRFRLSASWERDSSVEGNIVEKRRVITTLDDDFDEDEQAHDFHASDRSQIQFIYIPPTRDGTVAVTEFLKSRLWRAAKWTEPLVEAVDSGSTKLNESFKDEPAVQEVQAALATRS